MMYFGSFKQVKMIIFVLIPFLFATVMCQNETDTETTTLSFSTTSTLPNMSCEANTDCKSCVANTKCYFCESNGKCSIYTEILAKKECEVTKINYLTCKVTFQYLLIIIAVFGGIAALIITVFCCYCCCCKKSKVKLSKDDLKWTKQREERKQIAAERRKERSERTEEIRRKYGLVKDSNPYERFDA